MMIEVFNPATGDQLASVKLMNEDEIKVELAVVRARQRNWGASPLEQRTDVIRRFAATLAAQGRDVAELISKENGKTIQEAYETEILPVVYLAAYFTENADRILKPRPIPLKFFRHKWSMIEYRPRGVIYVISPWNFPCSIPMGEILLGT